MAESVKRRVTAARLAVAFVAAGTIAGATAWAQASPPPPTAKSSAVDAFAKVHLDSSNIKNGSLLFQDFKSGQVVSGDSFIKYKKTETSFKKAVNGDLKTVKGELGDVNGDISAIKGELGSYVKLSDADARYIKLSDAVVRGDGSVFTASKLVDAQAQTPTLLLDVPGMFTVDTIGSTIRITNTSGGDLGHSACGNTGGGTLSPGQSINCVGGGSTESIQFFSWGASGVSATLSFSSIAAPAGGGTAQDTVQILIGL